MHKFYKRTKIVATLGPVSESFEGIKSLILAGTNVFRLNTSHGCKEDHRQRIENIRKAAEELGVCVATLVDLQGPKIRIGRLIDEQEIDLENGQEVIFQHMQDQKDINIIPVDYEGIARDVRVGDNILIDDGRIIVRIDKTDGVKVNGTVVNGGALKSRKGLNIPGKTASVGAVTPRDIEFIQFAVEQKADFVALSFVRQKEDVLLAKKYIEEFGGKIPVISKIEKPQAIDNLEEIIKVSEGIMVARGDLGIELSPVEVPLAQKRIIQEANKQKKPVIVATQMLETMINEPIPTRAEASDVANAILDGADAIMLSAETSVGKFAPQAVEMMSKIAKSIEDSSFYKYNLDMEVSGNHALTRQAIVYGADQMVKYVNAKALICFSHMGYSSRLMTKLKPSVPIITISDLPETCRRMALSWGVYSYCRNWDVMVSQDFLSKLDKFLMDELSFKIDDYVIITGSSPHLISGRTNFTRVHRIGAEPELQV